MTLGIDTADATATVGSFYACRYSSTTTTLVLVVAAAPLMACRAIRSHVERVMNFKALEFDREIRAMHRRNNEGSIAMIRGLARRAGEWSRSEAPRVYFPARRARGAVPARQSFYQGAF